MLGSKQIVSALRFASLFRPLVGQWHFHISGEQRAQRAASRLILRFCAGFNREILFLVDTDSGVVA